MDYSGSSLYDLKVVNYLDVTLDLSTGKYYPYRKPDNNPLYINVNSNHPPSIIKQLPKSISTRISSLSCNSEEFNKASTIYNDALKSSGYKEGISYTKSRGQKVGKRKNRPRSIIWFNPPYSADIETNVAKTFLKLIDKHFPNHTFSTKSLTETMSKLVTVALATCVT